MSTLEEWKGHVRAGMNHPDMQTQAQRNTTLDQKLDRLVEKLVQAGNVIMPSSEDLANHIMLGGAFATEVQPDGKIKIIYIRPEHMV